MSAEDYQACPLCGRDVNKSNIRRTSDFDFIGCPNCGNFAVNHLWAHKQRYDKDFHAKSHLLRTYIRKRNEETSGEYAVLDSQETVEAVLAKCPTDFVGKTRALLSNLIGRQKHFGERMRLSWDMLSGLSFAVNDEEGRALLENLVADGLVKEESVTNASTTVSVTGRGIQEHESQRIVHAETERQAVSQDQLMQIPTEIIDSLGDFRVAYPNAEKLGFVMMRFGNTVAHEEIVEGTRIALARCGMTALRADDRQFHDDLYYNIMTYIYGCSFGIAVFERIENEDFNPNVSLEVGIMLGLRKPVCLLKDKTLKLLHTDMVGKLYRPFDPQDPMGTIPIQLLPWLKDKKLISDSEARTEVLSLDHDPREPLGGSGKGRFWK